MDRIVGGGAAVDLGAHDHIHTGTYIHAAATAVDSIFREIADILRESGHGQVKVEDVKDEIFDMVKPKDGLHITLDDLLRCGVAHTIINMIIDIDGFWAYDQRENIIHGEDEEPEESQILSSEKK